MDQNEKMCRWQTQYTPHCGSYLVEAVVGGRTRFFDATTYDGTNIGRYANMQGVIDALRDALHRSEAFTEFEEREWKVVNDNLKQQNNARFQVSGEDLELRATKDFPKSANPIEVFVSYGDIRSYWISAIVREPESYPPVMVNIIKFLFHSPQSNWTLEQKRRWGNCDDLLDESGRLSTLLDQIPS